MAHPTGHAPSPEIEATHLVTADTGEHILTACGLWSDDPALSATSDRAAVTCTECSELADTVALIGGAR
ncbi:hypothetical protein [Streptomyces sp. YPW6]|uniref:hypothetical protein n=1 Tax=Streptomyces sp. YPW6 TaxID=2840373 RepID=UPI003EB6D1BF